MNKVIESYFLLLEVTQLRPSMIVKSALIPEACIVTDMEVKSTGLYRLVGLASGREYPALDSSYESLSAVTIQQLLERR